jgi:catechol 2,3-dioxygenase-like lactoylglutathione lyase family enzyme
MPADQAIKTFGLTHLNLAVADPERSLRFYAAVFGVKEYYRDADSIQVQGPGPHDVLAFERDTAAAGRTGGIGHFGFRLTDPADIDAAVIAVERAGGTLLRRGEFAPGFPFAYVHDPDGYEIEIWFE